MACSNWVHDRKWGFQIARNKESKKQRNKETKKQRKIGSIGGEREGRFL